MGGAISNPAVAFNQQLLFARASKLPARLAPSPSPHPNHPPGRCGSGLQPAAAVRPRQQATCPARARHPEAQGERRADAGGAAAASRCGLIWAIWMMPLLCATRRWHAGCRGGRPGRWLKS